MAEFAENGNLADGDAGLGVDSGSEGWSEDDTCAAPATSAAQPLAAKGSPGGPMTLLLHHPACELHDVPDHPERPARTRSILQALRSAFSIATASASGTLSNGTNSACKAGSGSVGGNTTAASSSAIAAAVEANGSVAAAAASRQNALILEQLAPLVGENKLLLFHTKSHVDRIFRLCSRSENAFAAAEAAVAGGSTLRGPAGKSGRGRTAAAGRGSRMRTQQSLVRVDGDTAIMANSREAILRAAGAAIFAVDEVLAKRCVNSFCCVRPPGHHATPDTAMGFCFINNAAVAALHAAAVLEADSGENEAAGSSGGGSGGGGGSHGGGRRVAVIDFDVHHGNGTEALFAKMPNAFYGSTHQGPGFYPGTGSEDVRGVAGNIVNVFLPEGSGSDEFRAAYSEKILPALREFSPEFLVISAGFDAHTDDPLGGLDLEAEDYDWVTRELCLVAADTCQGRVVSVLEGGYNLRAISDSAVAHVRALVDAGIWMGALQDKETAVAFEAALERALAERAVPLKAGAATAGAAAAAGEGEEAAAVETERALSGDTATEGLAPFEADEGASSPAAAAPKTEELLEDLTAEISALSLEKSLLSEGAGVAASPVRG